MLFKPDKSVKKPDPRKIISIIEKNGDHNKSSFFKYLLTENNDAIVRLGYATLA